MAHSRWDINSAPTYGSQIQCHTICQGPKGFLALHHAKADVVMLSSPRRPQIKVIKAIKGAKRSKGESVGDFHVRSMVLPKECTICDIIKDSTRERISHVTGQWIGCANVAAFAGINTCTCKYTVAIPSTIMSGGIILGVVARAFLSELGCHLNMAEEPWWIRLRWLMAMSCSKTQATHLHQWIGEGCAIEPQGFLHSDFDKDWRSSTSFSIEGVHR